MNLLLVNDGDTILQLLRLNLLDVYLSLPFRFQVVDFVVEEELRGQGPQVLPQYEALLNAEELPGPGLLEVKTLMRRFPVLTIGQAMTLIQAKRNKGVAIMHHSRINSNVSLLSEYRIKTPAWVLTHHPLYDVNDHKGLGLSKRLRIKPAG